MDVKFDSKKFEFKQDLDEKDVEDAKEIKKMVNSKGWKILLNYMDVARESVIDAGKLGISSRAKRDLSDLKFAVLKGFDECRYLPDKIVKRAEIYWENRKVEEGQKNDGEQSDEY